MDVTTAIATKQIPGYSGEAALAALAALAAPVVAPPLLVVPRSEDGWYQWVAEEMDKAGATDDKGRPFKMPKPQTISGRLIIANAPAWAQSHAVREAIAGELATPEAVWLREQFEAGVPLSLLPPFCAELFTTFAPVLQRIGPDHYRAGTPPQAFDFTAASPPEALDKGRAWFGEQREAEIEGRLEKAREESRSLGALYREALAGRLKALGKFYAAPPDDGEMVAVVWANGAHDRYVVEGSEYRYGFIASATVAAVMGVIAAKGRRLRIPRPGDADAIYVAPAGWQRQEGGGMRRSGAVEQGGKAVGELRWRNGKFTLLDAKGQRIESLACTEKPGELLLAWGVSALLKKKAE